MVITTYAEYKSHIRGLVAEYGRQGILVGSIPLVFAPSQGIASEEGGVIRATTPPLRFRDNATLRVQEEVRATAANVELLRYSYHYERPGGYFFRYEREQSEDLIRKPEYHMHAVLNLPHFNAPPVNLEIILALITSNFYAQEVYSKQIIGQQVHLKV